jgi:hypothetical protein
VQVDAPPRVQVDAPPRVQVDAPPRVQFDLSPPRLIVESQATPIPKQPTIIASPESIADRVKNRRIQAPPLITAADITSIAERVAQRRRQSASPVLDEDTGKLLEYRQLLRDPKHTEIWTKAGANEFGRLAQGVGGRIDGTNTIFFVHKHEIPQDRLKDVTYIKFVSSIRTQKKEPHRIRATL